MKTIIVWEFRRIRWILKSGGLCEEHDTCMTFYRPISSRPCGRTHTKGLMCVCAASWLNSAYPPSPTSSLSKVWIKLRSEQHLWNSAMLYSGWRPPRTGKWNKMHYFFTLIFIHIKWCGIPNTVPSPSECRSSEFHSSFHFLSEVGRCANCYIHVQLSKMIVCGSCLLRSVWRL